MPKGVRGAAMTSSLNMCATMFSRRALVERRQTRRGAYIMIGKWFTFDMNEQNWWCVGVDVSVCLSLLGWCDKHACTDIIINLWNSPLVIDVSERLTVGEVREEKKMIWSNKAYSCRYSIDWYVQVYWHVSGLITYMIRANGKKKKKGANERKKEMPRAKNELAVGSVECVEQWTTVNSQLEEPKNITCPCAIKERRVVVQQRWTSSIRSVRCSWLENYEVFSCSSADSADSTDDEVLCAREISSEPRPRVQWCRARNLFSTSRIRWNRKMTSRRGERTSRALEWSRTEEGKECDWEEHVDVFDGNVPWLRESKHSAECRSRRR